MHKLDKKPELHRIVDADLFVLSIFCAELDREEL